MSALRKLRQAKLKSSETQIETATADSDIHSNNDSKAEDEVNETKPIANAFSLLNDEDEENTNDQEDLNQPQSNDTVEIASDTAKFVKSKKTEVSPAIDLSTTNSGKKNKKNKNKVSKNVNEIKSTASDDELDGILNELKVSENSNTAANSNNAENNKGIFAAGWSVLKCDSKYFDANLEIKQKFGAKAMTSSSNNDEDTKTPAVATTKRARQMARMLARSNPKKTSAASANNLSSGKIRFVKPSSDWPPFQSRGDIKLVTIQPSQLTSMDNNNSNTNKTNIDAKAPTFQTTSHIPYLLTGLGSKLFQFVPSQQYKQVYSEFVSILHSHNIQNCYYFSRSQPYFPESALQISEISAAQQEFVLSHITIQRLLFYYQQNWSFEFDLNGKNRLDPNTEVNKHLFTGLALHAQMLGKKACPRSALEICKFLLSLSPLLDTQCVSLFIDYYVLRSRTYQYLFDLVSQLDFDILTHFNANNHPWNKSVTVIAPRLPLILLPNILYGLALCRFYQDNEHVENNEDLKTEPYEGEITLPILPFKFTYAQNTAESTKDKSNNSNTNSKSQLSNLSASHLLQRAICMYPECIEQLLLKSGNENEVNKSEWKSIIKQLNSLQKTTSFSEKLVLVFIERSAQLYKNGAIVTWLKRECQSLISKINNKSSNSSNLNSFIYLRSSFLSGPVPESIRYLQKPSYTDTVPSLPPELLLAQQEERLVGGNMQHFDVNEIQHYLDQLARNGHQQLDMNAGPMAVFLRSLLPWNVPAPAQLIQRQQNQNRQNNVINDNNQIQNNQNNQNHQNNNQGNAENAEIKLDEAMNLINNLQNLTGQADLLEAVNPADAGGFNFDDYQFSSDEEGQIEEIEVDFSDNHGVDNSNNDNANNDNATNNDNNENQEDHQQNP